MNTATNSSPNRIFSFSLSRTALIPVPEESLLGEGRTKEEEGKGRVAKSWNGMLREGGASPGSRGIGYGRSWKLSGEQKKTWK